MIPFTVGKEGRGLVFCDKLLKHRMKVLYCVFLGILEIKGMEPLVNGVVNTEVQDEFRSCNAYAKEECRDCWAKLYCSGGCPANGYHATGKVNGVYTYGCELFKKRIECAVMIKVAENADEE